MTTHTTSILLRMPSKLKARIQRLAEDAGVSATSLMVTALNRSVGDQAPTDMRGGTIKAAQTYQWERDEDAALARGARPKPPAKPCTIDECAKPVHAHGWCVTHYRQWKRGNTPT